MHIHQKESTRQTSLRERQEILQRHRPVQASIALPTSPDEAIDGRGDKLLCVDAILIDLADVELDGTVLLGGDQVVGRRALAEDVGIEGCRGRQPYPRHSAWRTGPCRLVAREPTGEA